MADSALSSFRACATHLIARQFSDTSRASCHRTRPSPLWLWWRNNWWKGQGQVLTVYRNEDRYDTSNVVFRDGEIVVYEKKVKRPEDAAY